MTKQNYTKFNPKGKKELTYGECLDPAMVITEQADADQYLKDYIKHIQKYIDAAPREDKTAEQIAKENLGYYAGYFDNSVRVKVEKLFLCAHPVFGSIKEKGIPTNKEAFEMGRRRAKK